MPDIAEEAIRDLSDMDPMSQDWLDAMVVRIIMFTELLSGKEMFAYQRNVAARIIESVILGDGGNITFLCSRQAGKALALDTPILTTEGWKTMGDIAVGDYVFAPDGTATRVKVTSNVFEDHECFRVGFKDGQSIVADAEHRWTVWDLLKKQEVTLTTREMASSWEGTDDRFRYRYRVPTTAPVDEPEKDLPVDPYLLGVWLGDGSSYKAEVTTADPEVVAHIREQYETSYEYPAGAATTYGVLGLHPILKSMGLVPKGKHVPEAYLHGSPKQRMALLQGLMDTDGYAGARNHMEFTTTLSEDFAEDVLYLVRSLGWKATLREGRATLDGRDCGPKWRVAWVAYRDEPPFRLQRKIDSMRERPTEAWRLARTESVQVVGVTPVASVPTRCLGVEHPRHLFLAGRGLIPTHNTETVGVTISALMVLLPRLALIFPDHLGKFARGVMVGTFAPTDEQSTTLFERIKETLTSDRAREIMLDPEIDDIPNDKGKVVRLNKSKSFARMHTAHPQAKIESKSYHIILGDESQDIDERMWNKSIAPMGAFYNATKIMTGTPTTHKGVFYKTIQHNRRHQTRRGAREDHFQYNWTHCAKHNDNYDRYVRGEMLRLGEESDEFQMAYNLKWLLDKGMFIVEGVFDALGDVSMQAVDSWRQTPLVAGIDPASKQDYTVVTVMYVDWDRTDGFGFHDHRVLNWMETNGDWETQYFQIVDFLRNYSVVKAGVDTQGLGDVVANRLSVLMPDIEIIGLGSSPGEQSKRWKHLTQLVDRRLIGWPAHSHTRRLKKWKRFRQQMIDLEVEYRGPNLLAAAPDEAGAHDDYGDSLAIAAMMSTEDFTLPEIQVSSNPMFAGR